MSITMKQQKCPNCGGPLSAAKAQVVACPFCQSEFQPAVLPKFRIPAALPMNLPPTLGVFKVGRFDYRVHGRLAQGAHCEVFLARRDRALTELVILKVAGPNREPLLREWSAITLLRKQAPSAFIATLLPQPVIQTDNVAVYRWRSGFHFTFEDARAQYPDGVDPRACVWMWNRLLEQLASLHQLGYQHGAVSPAHLLLHPRDHGLMLCGWSACRPLRQSRDLADSALCIASLLGKAAPPPLLHLIKRAALFSDATVLKEELKLVARAAFGPPRFHMFVLFGQ